MAGGERGVVMIPTAISRMERGEDRDFLLELINENGSLMYAMAFQILGNEPVANDMVAEACMALMKKTAYLRTIAEEKQRLYILAIVKNNCLMYLRKHSRERLFYDGHELETSLASEDAVDDALIADAAQLRGRAMKLAVSGAFHSPYMHEAAAGLSDYMLMRGLRFSAHHLPLYANCTAQPYGDDAEELLARQVENPVLWETTVRNMLADGVDAFVECGAGKTLSGLIKKIAPEATVCRVEDPVTLMETLTTLGGRS